MEEDTVVITETAIGDYCSSCGQFLKETVKKCPNCGCNLILEGEE